MAVVPPALPDELVEEILLRLPPDDPASLLRASLISKDWGRTISSAAFRRRLHDFHQTPPLLGFLHSWAGKATPSFLPTTASSFSLAAPNCGVWRPLDCRHGRAVFLHVTGHHDPDLLVWDTITGTQRRVPMPSECASIWATLAHEPLSAAVFCAVDGCDHRDCHGGPFRVFLVFTPIIFTPIHEEDDQDEGFEVWASVFSSETRTWDRLTMMQSDISVAVSCIRGVLVGTSLLYFLGMNEWILEYDLARHSMTALHMPPYVGRVRNSIIILTEDGGLGVAEYSNRNLKLWTREASDGTDAHWVLSRVINLHNLLPSAALLEADRRVRVVGFSEGTNNIFLTTALGVFTIDLHSEKARKVLDEYCPFTLFPVVTFYTPVPRDEHQHPPSEAGGEVGEEKEKAVEETHEGSNAIQEGDLVNACFSHALKTRIPNYKEVALECASTEYGCALVQKSEDMDAPLDDVLKILQNEGSLTSDSDVEDSAAPSRKDHSEEALATALSQQDDVVSFVWKYQCKEKKKENKK